MIPEKNKLSKSEPATLSKLPAIPIGQENIDREDIVLPRVRLLQLISREVADGQLKAGHFYLSANNESLKELEVLFFFHNKSRVLFERAINPSSGEGIHCMSFDGKTGRDNKKCVECPFGMWDTNLTDEEKANNKTGGPECSIVFNYPCLVLNSSLPQMPVALSLMRTSIKEGRKINSIIKLARLQWWSKVYKVTSEMRKGAKGQYFVFKIKDERPATELEQQTAFSMYQSIMGKQVVVEQDEHETGN